MLKVSRWTFALLLFIDTPCIACLSCLSLKSVYAPFSVVIRGMSRKRDGDGDGDSANVLLSVQRSAEALFEHCPSAVINLLEITIQ